MMHQCCHMEAALTSAVLQHYGYHPVLPSSLPGLSRGSPGNSVYRAPLSLQFSSVLSISPLNPTKTLPINLELAQSTTWLREKTSRRKED